MRHQLVIGDDLVYSEGESSHSYDQADIHTVWTHSHIAVFRKVVANIRVHHIVQHLVSRELESTSSLSGTALEYVRLVLFTKPPPWK